MSERFSKLEKISPKTRENVFKIISTLREELNMDIDIEETPDIFTIIRNEEGETKEINFTKVGDKMTVGNSSFDLSEVIEARVRFPSDGVADAIEKLKSLK